MSWRTTHSAAALAAIKVPVDDGTTPGGAHKLGSELLGAPGIAAGTFAAGDDIRIRRSHRVVNVQSAPYNAPTDGVSDLAPALNLAIADIYANKGGVLFVPFNQAGYVLASPVVIDPGQYADGGPISVWLDGNVFTQTHNGWGLEFKTNGFDPKNPDGSYVNHNNGGRFGRKNLAVLGGNATFIGNAGAAGGIRATDTISFRADDVVFYGYPNGDGLQLYASSTTQSTWCEQTHLTNIRGIGCLTGIAGRCANPSAATAASFLGTKLYHCVFQGTVNGATLIYLSGGCWNSSLVGCGGFYNQDGATGGQGIVLDGSFRGSALVSCFIDTGQDSDGNNASTTSALTDLVFGPNYTTDPAWFPTLIGCNELELPLGWQDKLLVPGPFISGGGMSANGREVLRAPRTYYVAPTGSDTAHDGLTAGAPFATIAHALSVIYSRLDLASIGVTIQLADGTYTTPIVVTGNPLGLGTGSLVIAGNTATPGAVTIAATTGAAALQVLGGAKVNIRGLTVSTTGGGNGMQVDTGSTLTIGEGCQFGACPGGNHLQALTGSTVVILAAYKITGGAQIHWSVAGSRLVFGAAVIDASGIAFANVFVAAGDGSQVVVNGGSFNKTGSTGGRYFVRGLSLIQTYNQAADFFPGNANGYADAGSFGIYS